MGAYTLEKITGKPLYCFKYDEETGEIIRIEIPEYRTSVNRFTDRKTYYFDKPKINKSDNYYQVPEAKLDRYVSGKVYTFEDSEQYAKSIILETIIRKYNLAEAERLRQFEAKLVFLKAYPEFNNNDRKEEVL